MQFSRRHFLLIFFVLLIFAIAFLENPQRVSFSPSSSFKTYESGEAVVSENQKHVKVDSLNFPASSWIGPDWIHHKDPAEGNSWWSPPDWTKHRKLGSSPSSYGPPDEIHVNKGGPWDTTYVPGDYVHINGGDSKYKGLISKYIPPVDPKHIVDGPKKSNLVDGSKNHRTNGPETTSYSRFKETHVTVGTGTTYYVPSEYHITDSKNGKISSIVTGIVHITKGKYLSDFVDPSAHITSGPDASSAKYYLNGGGSSDDPDPIEG